MTLFVFALAEAMFSNYLTRQTQLFMSMALIVSLDQRRHVYESVFGIARKLGMHPDRPQSTFACPLGDVG